VIVLALVVAFVHARYVQTPVGQVWDSCMVKVENGAHLIEDPVLGITKILHPDGRTQVLRERCPMPIRQTAGRKLSAGAPADGWQVWSTFQHPNNDTFVSFLGNFSVPLAPTSWGASDSGILYFFTGLQSDNWVPVAHEPPAPPTFDIIQPVLQFGGGSENGGGKFWGLASWYVTVNSNVAYSTLLPLKPGNIIFGNMTKTGPSTWYIGGTVNGQTTSIIATHPRLTSQPWAYCTQELYNIASCSYEPPSNSAIYFTGMSMRDVNGPIIPDWQSNSNGNNNHCSSTLQLSSPANLAIKF